MREASLKAAKHGGSMGRRKGGSDLLRGPSIMTSRTPLHVTRLGWRCAVHHNRRPITDRILDGHRARHE